EVKADWAELVAQAAIYARCLFAASPSRPFVLVITLCHKSNHVRFLLFHRSG
ncbi:hypothetical protein BD410DRAFT_696657, partial [Rickenella mellea]